MKLKFAALAAIALASAAMPAAATTITFTALTNDQCSIGTDPYVEQGFQFTNSGFYSLFSWGSACSFLSADPTGGTLNNNIGGTTTILTKVGGGTFDFNSVDLTDVYNSYYTNFAGDVRFAFTDGSGTTYQTVTIDGLPGFQTFTFNKTGLLSVAYLPLTTYGPWIQADNFVLDGAVPEPASWALMIAGFGMVGAAMRRRKVALAG